MEMRVEEETEAHLLQCMTQSGTVPQHATSPTDKATQSHCSQYVIRADQF